MVKILIKSSICPGIHNFLDALTMTPRMRPRTKLLELTIEASTTVSPTTGILRTRRIVYSPKILPKKQEIDDNYGEICM